MAMHEHTRGRLLLVVRTSVMTCAVHWTKVITLVSAVRPQYGSVSLSHACGSCFRHYSHWVECTVQCSLVEKWDWKCTISVVCDGDWKCTISVVCDGDWKCTISVCGRQA